MEQVKIELDGKEIVIESGKMAKLADGAVTVTLGHTIVLATAVAAKELKEEIEYFPLTVDYRERPAAAGRFPGGYIKREGRPTEKEILTSRLVDRPIRPLFPQDFYNEVQVLINVLSADGQYDPDTLAIIGASAALSVSGIPFAAPIGGVRVGRVGGHFIANPTHHELEQSDIDFVVAGTEKGILMIEGASNEVSEEVMLEAVFFGHERIKKIARAIVELKAKSGKPLMTYTPVTVEETVLKKLEALVKAPLDKAITIFGKKDREQAIAKIKEEAFAKILAELPETPSSMLSEAFYRIEKAKVRHLVKVQGKRSDGRGVTDIRPITCEVGLLPRTHGSAMFTRGETQALVTATLGTETDEQRYESLLGEESKRFMLHYNFPPFSTGEIKRVMGPGRREIGHGALAERSLLPVIPPEEKFPYTIRIISDILESNGSSSMATVCGGALALMDAGVPIQSPVAGVAMGLVLEENEPIILSDILGAEDALGDMDFKVAGTAKGITGFQMDIKIEGISHAIMKKALEQARAGRMHVLGIMNQAIHAPRESIAEHAPKIFTIQIDPEKIGMVIGPGGKNIKKIIEESGADININDDGKVSIASVNKEGADIAMRAILAITKEVEVGEIYDGVVKSVMDFGAFVEILPGKEGLVHISKLAPFRVNKTADVCKMGDKMRVKVMLIDEKGRISLSRKDAMTPEELKQVQPK